MKFSISLLSSIALACTIGLLQDAQASVYLPYTAKTIVTPPAGGWTSSSTLCRKQSHAFRYHLQNKSRFGGLSATNSVTAMAIPGNGVAEQVVVGGFLNFLSIYNLVITARILLSWFPQAQGVALLQPVYTITDPFLNLFRGVIPPLFGLDFSPILAFVLLNLASNATVALGCDTDNLSPDQLRALRRRGILEQQAASPSSTTNLIQSLWSQRHCLANFGSRRNNQQKYVSMNL